MIKVLHYVGKMDRGGMETFIMNLLRNIDRTEIQFDFAIHGTRNGDYESEIFSYGGRFFQFPHMRKNPIAYRRAWKEFWKKHKEEYKAFHFHTNSLANVIALEEAAMAEIPIRIVHAHSSFAYKGRLQMLNNILHYIHKKSITHLATNLCACSEKAACWLFGGMSIGKDDVNILKNGVNMEYFKFSPQHREKIRTQLGLDDKKVIGHVGAFLTVKNHEFLIKIISDAYIKDNSIRAIFVGDGELRSDIENKIHDKGLTDVIYLLGIRSDVEKLLQGMDLFVMPSLYEGLPMSLVEAQASGLSILMSDTITNEILLNENTHKLSINSVSAEWANYAIDILNKNKRCIEQKNLIDAGFNILDAVREYRRMLDK